MVSGWIQRPQAKVAMGHVNLGNCIVFLCSAYICCISAQTADPSIGSSLKAVSAVPEASSLRDSAAAAPHPSTGPSAAPSASSSQLGRLLSSPTPVSVSLSPKDFPLLPTPIDMWDNSPAPLWWNFPGDQSGAYNSPPTPIAPIADTNLVPQLPLDQGSPTSAQKKDPPHILMKDERHSRRLGGGAKAGISLAVIAVISLAIIGIYVHITRKQNMKKANTFREYI